MSSDPTPQTKISQSDLKATPEVEDFAHKYTEEGSGKVGGALIDNYFKKVADLVVASGIDQITGATAIEIGCGEGFSTQRISGLLPGNVKLSFYTPYRNQ